MIANGVITGFVSGKTPIAKIVQLPAILRIILPPLISKNIRRLIIILTLPAGLIRVMIGRRMSLWMDVLLKWVGKGNGWWSERSELNENRELGTTE
jgi:hypothetical protein